MRRVRILASHWRSALFNRVAHLSQHAKAAQEYKPQGYPVFDSSFKSGGKRKGIEFENCLSYALNIQDTSPTLWEFESKTNHHNPLEYVAAEINKHFNDRELVFPAPHKKGQLPPLKKDYYVISLAISYYQKFSHEHLHYQESDYHFMVQNADGFFSHRRGEQAHPERHDSKQRPIFLPEFAKLFYMALDKNDQPYCVDYQFVGYLYVKTHPIRLRNTIPYTAWFNPKAHEDKMAERPLLRCAV